MVILSIAHIVNKYNLIVHPDCQSQFIAITSHAIQNSNIINTGILDNME